MARILVTGSAGHLGGEVMRIGAAAGHDVIGTWFRRPVAGGVALDVRDEGAVRAVLGDVRPDAVVHTAYVQGGDDLWPTTAEAPAMLARATAAAGIRLVHVSTDLVFDGDKEGRYTEADEARPVMPYGEAKAAAERAVLAADPAAVVARSSLIYGGAAPSHQERLVERDDIAFFTDELRTPVEAGDLAAALLELAAEVDHRGVIHLGGADTVSRHELAALIAGPERGPSLRAGRSVDAPGRRPRNCALDSSLAASLLRTRLRGVREVLSGE